MCERARGATARGNQGEQANPIIVFESEPASSYELTTMEPSSRPDSKAAIAGGISFMTRYYIKVTR